MRHFLFFWPLFSLHGPAVDSESRFQVAPTMSNSLTALDPRYPLTPPRFDLEPLSRPLPPIDHSSGRVSLVNGNIYSPTLGRHGSSFHGQSDSPVARSQPLCAVFYS
jgi:hypothetical protein